MRYMNEFWITVYLFVCIVCVHGYVLAQMCTPMNMCADTRSQCWVGCLPQLFSIFIFETGFCFELGVHWLPRIYGQWVPDIFLYVCLQYLVMGIFHHVWLFTRVQRIRTQNLLFALILWRWRELTDWRIGLLVKSTYWSCWGPSYDWQYLHDGPQPSSSLVSGY